MSKRITALMFLTTIVCIFGLFSLCSFSYWMGDTDDKMVYDDDNLIPDSCENEIASALLAAETRTGVSFRVYAYEGYEYYDIHDFLMDGGFSIPNLVLLVIQKQGDVYYYFLDTYGSANTLISDKEVDRILDTPEVYDNIKSGSLSEGILAFTDVAETAVSGTLRPPFMSVFLPCLVIALVAAVASVVGVVLFYRRKLHSESYPLERYAKLQLNVSHDTFLTKSITRVRVNSSSSGGGRSGGGGGGGGRRGGR